MNRHQRRAQAKDDRSKAIVRNNPFAALAGLASMTSKLEEIIDSGDQMGQLSEQLTTVLAETERVREAFTSLLAEAEGTKYAAERQRFVTLRLVGTVNPVDPADVAGLIALEEQYRAEYDAIQALIQLVTPKQP